MTTNLTIQRAAVGDAPEVALIVGELLDEIMAVIGSPVFHFSLLETTTRLEDFIGREKYFVFVAGNENAQPIGFIALYESHALYAEGVFGTIPELYVRPAFRSQDIGFHLVEQAKRFGISRGWARLEVTTPPLPQFEKTLAFYEREGFTISGGRKLKLTL